MSAHAQNTNQNIPSATATLPDLGQQNYLSDDFESAIGARINGLMLQEKNNIADALLLDEIEIIGNRLIASSPVKIPFSLRYHLLANRQTNAFALPGGPVGVFSGLILNSRRVDEFAAVMGHEIAHVAQRHLSRRFERNSRDQTVSTLAVLTGLGLLFASINNNSDVNAALALFYGGGAYSATQQLQYSRNDEHEADRLGYTLLQQSGYDTRYMISFFERLNKTTINTEQKEIQYLRTHPLTTQRIADIRGRLLQDQGRVVTRKVEDDQAYQWFRLRTAALSATSPTERRTQIDRVLAEDHPATLGQDLRRYGAALIALEEEQYAQGIELITPLVVAQPNHPHLRYTLLQLQLRQGQIDPQAANSARLQFKSYRAFTRLYAEALLIRGQVQEAVDFLRIDLRQTPTDLTQYQRLARAYQSLDKDVLQHSTLAEMQAQLFQYQRAIEQIEIALSRPTITASDKLRLQTRLEQFQASANKEKEVIQALR